MAVVQRLLQHLQASGVETVMYQSQGAANVDFDRRTPPFGYMVTVSRRKCDIDRLLWQERAAVVVFFLDLAPLDYNGLANEATVEDMANYARRFLWAVLNDPTLKVTADTVEMRTAFDRYDGNLTGVSLEMEVAASQGECLVPAEI
jgi:hypothetical protein